MVAEIRDLTFKVEQIGYSISEAVSSFSKHEERPLSWPIEIQIFEGWKRGETWKTILHEPLPRKDYEELAFYLNDILNSQTWPTAKAKHAQELIGQYGSRLFESSKIRHHWTPSPFSGQLRVKVEIFCHRKFLDPADDTGPRTRSIHSLHWELLEDLGVWCPAKPSFVTVSRILQSKPRNFKLSTADTALTPVRSYSQTGPGSYLSTFNVLLVVARDVDRIHRTGNVDPYGPIAIPAAVLKIQQRLRTLRHRLQVLIRVARPGSLERLKIMLDDSTIKYNVVHFDMHGRISTETNHAELQFNADRGELTEHWVDGDEIAEVMRDNKIQCVVTSSCFSAYADAAANANLAQLMVENQVSNVLGMSFKMNDTMSERFFNRFYEELFIEQCELSEAARRSRAILKTKPRRYYYGATPGWKEIDDWFVPVVYSSGAPFFAQDKNWLPSQGRWTFLMGAYGICLCLAAIYIATIVNHWSAIVFWRIKLSIPLLSSLLIAFVGYFASSVIYHGTQSQPKPGSKQPNELSAALELSMKDKTNILRLEHGLHQTRKVYFYAQRNEGIATPQKLLDNLLPIWKRTGMIDDIIWLDWSTFKRPLKPQCWWYESRIRFRNSWLVHRVHDPQLIVVVHNIHELYVQLEDQELKKARTSFEDWLKRVFPHEEDLDVGVISRTCALFVSWCKKLFLIDSASTVQPYLILTGQNRDMEPEVVRDQLIRNFARVPSLVENVCVTEYHRTDIFANVT